MAGLSMSAPRQVERLHGLLGKLGQRTAQAFARRQRIAEVDAAPAGQLGMGTVALRERSGRAMSL